MPGRRSASARRERYRAPPNAEVRADFRDRSPRSLAKARDVDTRLGGNARRRRARSTALSTRDYRSAAQPAEDQMTAPTATAWRPDLLGIEKLRRARARDGCGPIARRQRGRDPHPDHEHLLDVVHHHAGQRHHRNWSTWTVPCLMKTTGESTSPLVNVLADPIADTAGACRSRSRRRRSLELNVCRRVQLRAGLPPRRYPRPSVQFASGLL